MYYPMMVSTGQALTPPAFVGLASHPLRWRLLTALADSDYRVRELVALLDEPQNLLSYHLQQLRTGGLVTARRSSHDGRDTYYHLDLERCALALAETATALHPALDGAASSPFPRSPVLSRPVAVLFVCTGNSIRSPIAGALLRHHGGNRVSVTSAGIHPRARLHTNAVRVLDKQFGIDVSGQHPTDIAALTGRRFDRVVTLCDQAREHLPQFAHHPHPVHWSVPEPTTQGTPDRVSYREFRQVAAEIDTRVRHLLPSLTPADH
jgi:ArsR family transcriptional regulator, arsenate/arsenite/antimonite-responsive transcriptional repressor / arsenate reductase (thioredoxin)